MHRKHAVSRTLLMIPPSLNYRIVSDQAIIVSACNLLHSRGFKIYLLSNKGMDDCHVPSHVTLLTLPRQRHIRTIMQYALMFRFRTIAWFATDVMDGAYGRSGIIRQANIFRFLQYITSIYAIGFSFRDNAPAILAPHLQLLKKVYFASRDVESRHNFETFTHLNADLCADIAYCLHGKPLSEPLRMRIEQMKASHSFVIAVNISTHFLYTGNTDPAAIAIALRALIAQGAAIVWIPSDFRNYKEHGTDLTVHQHIIGMFSAQEQEHMLNIDYMLHPSELKTLLGKVDCVLTGRMHLLILALTEKTVPFALSYHDKFRIELASWNLENNIIPNPENIEPAIMNFIRSKNACVSDDILKSKQQLAMVPFDHICGQ